MPHRYQFHIRSPSDLKANFTNKTLFNVRVYQNIYIMPLNPIYYKLNLLFQ